MSIPESVALSIGSIVILATIGTWMWKQAFGAAGASLLVCGVAPIGFPVFGNIQVKAAGIEVSLDQRIEQALKEDPKAALAAIDNTVYRVFDESLDGNTTSSKEQIELAQRQLQKWRQDNEQLSALAKMLRDQAMTPIRNIR